MPTKNSKRKTLQRAMMPPLQPLRHSRARALPAEAALASRHSRRGNEFTQAEGRDGGRQRSLEAILDPANSAPKSWRSPGGVCTNCLVTASRQTTAETSDSHHAQALTLPEVQLPSRLDSSPLRPLQRDTLEAFTAWHKQ